MTHKFADLAEEMKIEIFKQLDNRELKEAALVCPK